MFGWVQNFKDSYHLSELIDAIDDNDIAYVQQWLINNPSSKLISEPYSSHAPSLIIYAAQRKNIGIVKAFLKAGARLDTEKNKVALAESRKRGLSLSVRLLLIHTQVQLDTIVRDTAGKTATLETIWLPEASKKSASTQTTVSIEHKDILVSTKDTHGWKSNSEWRPKKTDEKPNINTIFALALKDKAEAVRLLKDPQFCNRLNGRRLAVLLLQLDDYDFIISILEKYAPKFTANHWIMLGLQKATIAKLIFQHHQNCLNQEEKSTWIPLFAATQIQELMKNHPELAKQLTFKFEKIPQPETKMEAKATVKESFTDIGQAIRKLAKSNHYRKDSPSITGEQLTDILRLHPQLGFYIFLCFRDNFSSENLNILWRVNSILADLIFNRRVLYERLMSLKYKTEPPATTRKVFFEIDSDDDVFSDLSQQDNEPPEPPKPTYRYEAANYVDELITGKRKQSSTGKLSYICEKFPDMAMRIYREEKLRCYVTDFTKEHNILHIDRNPTLLIFLFPKLTAKYKAPEGEAKHYSDDYFSKEQWIRIFSSENIYPILDLSYLITATWLDSSSINAICQSSREFTETLFSDAAFEPCFKKLTSEDFVAICLQHRDACLAFFHNSARKNYVAALPADQLSKIYQAYPELNAEQKALATESKEAKNNAPKKWFAADTFIEYPIDNFTKLFSHDANFNGTCAGQVFMFFYCHYNDKDQSRCDFLNYFFDLERSKETSIEQNRFADLLNYFQIMQNEIFQNADFNHSFSYEEKSDSASLKEKYTLIIKFILQTLNNHPYLTVAMRNCSVGHGFGLVRSSDGKITIINAGIILVMYPHETDKLVIQLEEYLTNTVYPDQITLSGIDPAKLFVPDILQTKPKSGEPAKTPAPETKSAFFSDDMQRVVTLIRQKRYPVAQQRLRAYIRESKDISKHAKDELGSFLSIVRHLARPPINSSIDRPFDDGALQYCLLNNMDSYHIDDLFDIFCQLIFLEKECQFTQANVLINKLFTYLLRKAPDYFNFLCELVVKYCGPFDCSSKKIVAEAKETKEDKEATADSAIDYFAAQNFERLKQVLLTDEVTRGLLDAALKNASAAPSCKAA